MSNQAKIQQEITDIILDELRCGTVPWRKPWSSDKNCGAPTSVATRRSYSGINPILLDLVGMKRGYLSRWWGTYPQWASLGAQVRKRPDDVKPGRWGTNIVLWKQIKKSKDDNGEAKPESFPLLRYFTVFNVDQVDGESVDHLRASRDTDSGPVSVDYEQAQDAIEATGAEIVIGGDQPCYTRPVGEWPHHISGDFIRMPRKQQFPAEHEFYSTILHELVHWTECRRGWSGSYAMGELIAEIGAAFLCAQLNIPNRDDLSNHSAYVEHWLKELEEDERAIMRAASQASKATELILSFSREAEPQEQELQTA